MLLDKNEKGIRNAIIVMLFLFLSMITPFFPGFFGDMLCWQVWTVQIVDSLPDAYDSENNYMPLYQYVLYAYGKLMGTDEAIYQNVHLLRMLTFLFDFAGLWYVYKWINRRVDYLLILLFSMLNVSYVYNSLIWGQVDGILASLSFISIYYAFKRRMTLSAFFFIVALNMKLQAIVFLPVWGLLWINTIAQERKMKVVLQPLAVILAVQVLLLIPFMLRPDGLKQVADVILNSVDYFPKVSMSAFNLWYWFVPGDPMKVLDSNIFVAGMTYKTVGRILFLSSSFLVLLPLLISVYKQVFRRNISKRPTSELIWLTCALVSILFFFTNTQMHERYVHPAFIFITAYAFCTRKWSVYTIFSIAYLLTLEKVLKGFKLKNYETVIFDGRFIAGLYAIVIVLLSIDLYKAMSTTRARLAQTTL